MASNSKPRSAAAPEAPKNKLAPKGAAAVTGRGATGKPSHVSPPAKAPCSRSPAPSSPTSEMKPSPDRRSPKLPCSRLGTPPDKQPLRAARAADPQSRLQVVQEDLKKAKEQLALVAEEKSKVVEELRGAKASAEEAAQKLQAAMTAQREAEENVEAHKRRIIELEKAAAVATAKEEEDELLKKLESIEKQRLEDASTLRCVAEELEKAKRELAEAVESRNSALSHANEAAKTAKVNAQKVELLNGEVGRLQGLLSSELENKAKEAVEVIAKLEAEVSELRLELDRAKEAEEKTVVLQNMVKKLRVDIAAAKNAETAAAADANDWMQKAEDLEIRLEKANEGNRLKGDSLISVTRELDAVSALLQERESENSALKDTIETLEDELAMQKTEVEKCRHCLSVAQREVETLKPKIAAAEEAIGNEKKLSKELEDSREECEEAKKAMRDLASSLQEASAEARAALERFAAQQAAMEGLQAQVEELYSSLDNAKEGYQVKLDEANYEIVCLHKTVQRLELEAKNMSEEWRAKELGFMDSIKKSEAEAAAGAESTPLSEARVLNAEMEAKLSEKERELQRVMAENNELRFQEEAALEKIKQLTSLLAEAKSKGANGEARMSPRSVRTTASANNGSRNARRSYELQNPNPEGNGAYDDDDDDDEPETAFASKPADEGSLTDDNALSLTVWSSEGMNNGSASRKKQQQHLLKKFGRVFKKNSRH